MSIATVDVYGCDYITANGVLYLYIIIGRITPCGGVYHIGVGSSVVCSTVSGNAKASISGTDNSSSTLFLCLESRMACFFLSILYKLINTKIMEKKNYMIPSMEVVALDLQGSLLAGSGEGSVSNSSTTPDISTDGLDYE